MILFKDDWDKYPDAIADTQTLNKSYIKLAKMYKAMGVENYYFHLALMQPELQGVDPHSEDLTVEQVVLIKAEILANPWYYLREVARIPASAGGESSYFFINRGVAAAWWCYLNHQDYNLTMPRQTGKSTSTYMMLSWLLFVKYRGTKILLLTKDSTLRGESIDIIKKIQDLLPPYLNPIMKKDLTNTETITCIKYKNRLYTAIPQNSEISANKIGRGMTCATYVVDEGPFVKYLEKSLTSMLAGANNAFPKAAEKGIPYGVMYTTTAGSKGDPDGLYYYEMVTGGVIWDEAFLDLKNDVTLRDMVIKATTGLKPIVNITMSHLQLGYDDAWLKAIIQRVGSKGDDANKDMFNLWSDGSFRSPFSKRIGTAIKNSEADPKWIEFTKENYKVNWYIKKEDIARRMSIGKYIVGLDPSEAMGKDAIGFFVLDAKSLETICTMSVDETNIFKLTAWIVNFMVKYENTIIIPERRSTGSTIISALLLEFNKRKINPFKRIFNTVVNNGEHNTKEGKALIQAVRNYPDEADKAKKYFGFATSGSGEFSRAGLYDVTLSRAVNYAGPILKDKQTIGEVLGLSVKNNRIDHSSAGHDDCVIAWLLNIWFLSSARNLDYYDVHEPMADAIDFETRAGYVENAGMSQDSSDILRQNREQQELKKKIEDYLELIKQSTDELLTMRYEANIVRLSNRLKDSDYDTLTISELIKSAKEEKRGKNKLFKKAA